MTEQLIAHRHLLYALAYRILGSAHDAEDVLQEAFLRWSAVDANTVDDPRGYLMRTVSHLAVDALRKRKTRREVYVGQWLPEPIPTSAGSSSLLGPVEAAEQQDSISIAALHLLERLTAPQRGVFVLRTAFGLGFQEIADTLGRSPDDCRQLYRRALTRMDMRGKRRAAAPSEHQRLLAALLNAIRGGDLKELGQVLAEDVTVWSDGGGRTKAAQRPIKGVGRVSRFLCGVFGPHRGRLRFETVEMNYQAAAVVREGCATQLIAFAAADRVSDVYLLSNPDKLRNVCDRIPVHEKHTRE